MKQMKARNSYVIIVLLIIVILVIIGKDYIRGYPKKPKAPKNPKFEPIHPIVVQNVEYPKTYATRRQQPFKMLGYLKPVGNGQRRTRITPLYGRRLHTSSTLWNYQTEINGMIVPLNINNQQCSMEHNEGCKEIFDGEIIELPENGGNNEVVLY